MQIVQALANAHVLDAAGRPVYVLEAGKRYVLTNGEAGRALRDGAGELVRGLDRVLPSYDRQSLTRHRLILPFIGRLGDAVVTASCLAALTARYPELTVDIAAPEAAREVFAMMPRFGELLPYPLHERQVGDYDFYLSFEEIDAVPGGAQRSCGDVFSACLRTPRPRACAAVTVPAAARERWNLAPISRPRVAIHAGDSGSLKAYPDALAQVLTDRLVEAGFEVYRIGTSGASCDPTEPLGCHVHDLTGKTVGPEDLAAVLAQMQVVVTCDSFPMHLSGALGVSTVALFAATDAVIASDYPSVRALQSGAACSPCGVAEGACPLGHGRCVAQDDRALSPESIVRRVESFVASVVPV